MNDIEILKTVTVFADDAHGHQLRRYSEDRYIVHPLRVMEKCRTVNTSIAILASAILHDVLEDTAVTPSQLHSFLLTVMNAGDAARTLELVVDLTDVYVHNAFPEMNRAKRKEMERQRLTSIASDAQTIKYADILDNAEDIFNNDRNFAPRFLNEGILTLAAMTKGNQQLRTEAIAFVESCIQLLKQ